MTTTKIEPIKVRGAIYYVVVKQGRDQAEFICELSDGEEVRADTLCLLIDRVKNIAGKKQKQVSIPVCKAPNFHNGQIEDYTATGIHTSNGGILLRNTDSGKTSQHSLYDDVLLRPVSREDRRILVEHANKILALQKYRDDLVLSYSWGTSELKAEIARRQRV